MATQKTKRGSTLIELLVVIVIAICHLGMSTAHAEDAVRSSSLMDGWTLIIDDDFTRNDTTPPESIGSPHPSAVDAWADLSKSWRILNRTLVPTVAGAACGGHGAIGPVRPLRENALNQGAELTTGPMPASDTITAIPYSLLLRIVPGSAWGSCYSFKLQLNPKAGTAAVTVGTAGLYGPFSGIVGPTFPVLVDHSYVLTATARSLYPGGFTILSYTVADATSPGTTISSGQSATVPTMSASLSAPGAVGIQQERSDLTRSDLEVISRFRSFVEPDSSLHTISYPLVVSTSGNIVTISGKGWTPGSPGTPVFVLSGLADCRITSQEILSPTLARLTISTGHSVGHLSVSDPSSGGTCKIGVSKKAAPLLTTNLIPIPDTAKTVRILGGIVTGGQAPYTYQWYRSTNWSFSPDKSTEIVGATQLDLLDTPPDSQCYAYKLVVSDSSAPPLTTTSPAAPGMRNWSTTPVLKPTSTKIPPLRIGWIGDSITAPGTDNVVKTLALLSAAGVTVSSSTNRGVPGSQSMTDSKGWHPSAAPSKPGGTNIYSSAIAAFKEADVNVIMLMLGSNESNYGLNYKSTYLANINAILAQLAVDLPGVPVILNTPALATRAVGGSDANEAHIAFVDALDQAAAANPNARRGDRNMPEWSYGRYLEYNDEIHPNAAGQDSYSRYWADALLRGLQSQYP